MPALFPVTANYRLCVFGVSLAVFLSACHRRTQEPATPPPTGQAAPSCDTGLANVETESKAAAPADPEPFRRCFPKDDALSPPRVLSELLARATEKLDQAGEDKPVCVGKELAQKWAQGPLKQALACCDEALRLDENNVEALHNRALVCVGLSRLTEAERAFAHALAADPNDPETLAGAAAFYIHHSAVGTSHTRIGLLHARRGAELIRKSLKHRQRSTPPTQAQKNVPDPTQPTLAHGLPPRLSSAKDGGLQKQLLSRLLLLQGQALVDLGRPKQALGPLDEAIALSDSHQARYERGLLLFDLCRFKEAEALFSLLVRRLPEPDNAWSHHQLGLVLEMLGNQTAAEREFAWAQKLAPEQFRAPLPVSADAFVQLVGQQVAQLPRASLEDLKLVRLELSDLPLVEDLTVEDSPLSPTIVGLFRGLPLGVAGSEPRSIVLYRKNLLRLATTMEELKMQIRTTLLHELGHVRGEDDDELRDQGLE